MAKDRFIHALPAVHGCILAATLPVWRADLVRLLAQARVKRRRSDQRQWLEAIASIDAMTVSLADFSIAGVEQRASAFLSHSATIEPGEVLPYLELLPRAVADRVKAEDWRRRWAPSQRDAKPRGRREKGGM